MRAGVLWVLTVQGDIVMQAVVLRTGFSAGFVKFLGFFHKNIMSMVVYKTWMSSDRGTEYDPKCIFLTISKKP